MSMTVTAAIVRPPPPNIAVRTLTDRAKPISDAEPTPLGGHILTGLCRPSPGFPH